MGAIYFSLAKIGLSGVIRVFRLCCVLRLPRRGRIALVCRNVLLVSATGYFLGNMEMGTMVGIIATYGSSRVCKCLKRVSLILN